MTSDQATVAMVIKYLKASTELDIALRKVERLEGENDRLAERLTAYEKEKHGG